MALPKNERRRQAWRVYLVEGPISPTHRAVLRRIIATLTRYSTVLWHFAWNVFLDRAQFCHSSPFKTRSQKNSSYSSSGRNVRQVAVSSDTGVSGSIASVEIEEKSFGSINSYCRVGAVHQINTLISHLFDLDK